ncbi:nucleotide-binding domain containing protein [Rhodobacter calidifons]|uniref:Gfo/Idh/MocA family oxidoreductase n=1 Tax=Rhodobacter calidifons TaxID=2715277 RepID=A0ABX0G3D4_9RHOB|nr:nucleotide-binding domain containing protein [Rhodobacter calidifons]NHB75393.1 Gfo/Idh/MocA family oxidoreductase [Rhodobacter calidifons]
MRGWAEIDGVRIVAVCDTDPAKARAFALDFGALAYTDAGTMLAEVNPDFTDIVTTVAAHRSLVELAARHSRGVTCQKPFAETLDDGDAMVAACAAAGVPLLVHENFRWQSPYRALGAALAAGAIGAPRFLRLSFRHAFDIYANQPYLAEVRDLALVDPAAWEKVCRAAEEAATAALGSGQSVILASARGPDDPALAAARTAYRSSGLSVQAATARLGAGFGRTLRGLHDRRAASRFAVAGGDTSSFATRAFGAVALTAEAEIAPAVPLMKAHFHQADAACDWIVKGGQMGPEDLFVRMRDGVARSDPEARLA